MQVYIGLHIYSTTSYSMFTGILVSKRLAKHVLKRTPFQNLKSL